VLRSWIIFTTFESRDGLELEDGEVWGGKGFPILHLICLLYYVVIEFIDLDLSTITFSTFLIHFAPFVVDGIISKVAFLFPYVL
jgi:hypothetical protein